MVLAMYKKPKPSMDGQPKDGGSKYFWCLSCRCSTLTYYNRKAAAPSGTLNRRLRLPNQSTITTFLQFDRRAIRFVSGTDFAIYNDMHDIQQIRVSPTFFLCRSELFRASFRQRYTLEAQ
jgi:hypothetical protein